MNSNITFEEEALVQGAADLSKIATEMEACFRRITTIFQEVKQSWNDEQGQKCVSRFEEDVQPKLSRYYNAIAAHSKHLTRAVDFYAKKIESMHQSMNA